VILLSAFPSGAVAQAKAGLAPQPYLFDGHDGAQSSPRPIPAVADGSHTLQEGDILLEAGVNRINPGAKPDAVSIFQTQSLWPKVNGVATVYYVIDSNSASSATPTINSAIDTFNGDFTGVIQWVPWVSGDGTAYVDIDLNAGDYSGQCEAAEGYEAIAAQPMGGSASCTVGTVLHEMGHIVGLWHEQSRSDASTYITFNYSNVIKGSIGNFENISSVLGDAQNLTAYDYASVMEYPSFSFTRNGGPVIETIPAGMPLSGSDGVPVPANPDYSAGDKEAIRRLYGAPPTSVTVTCNPVGLQVVVDGTAVTTPQTYAWALNSTHTLSVAGGVQTLTGEIANSTTSATLYYTYGRWSDSTSQTHTITVTPGNGQAAFPATGPQVATYSANFIQLVPYTPSVYPSGSGTVAISPQPQSYSGVSGQFLTARQQATLTATAASGYSFYAFLNGPYYLPGGVGANPKTFYVPDTGLGINPAVEFSNTPVYTVDVTPDSFSSNLGVTVDGSFWYTPKNFSYAYDKSWAAESTHTLSLASPQYPYSGNSRFVFSSWSDGGAITHTTAGIPATSSSFIATLTPQFLAGTNFAYPPCGGTGTLSPASPTGDGFYPSGQSLQYTASAGAGWTFAGWTYDVTGAANPASLTATDETLVFANFNITNTPLTVTGLSPATITAGSGASTLTISGTGFAAGSLVSVNGIFRSVTFVNSTTLQVPLTAADAQSPAVLQVYVENFPSGSTGCAVFGYQTLPVAAATSSGTPSVSLSPTTVTFPNTNVGSTSATITVTLKNTGTAALTGISLSLAGTNPASFTLPSSAMLCGTSLAAGASCTFGVAFQPAAAGALSAVIDIADNASGTPQTVSVSGTGVQVLPTVAFDGIGSSGIFLELGLVASSATNASPAGLGATCLWTTRTSGVVFATDNSANGAGKTDTGSAWVAWTPVGGSCATVNATTVIYSYLQTDAVVGTRCLFNGCTVKFGGSGSASAGLIGGSSEVALAPGVASALNGTGGTGLAVTAAATELRPEDAEFAIARALTPCGTPVASGSQYLGLGYTNGEAIESYYSGTKFNVINFALPATYSVTTIGVTPVLVVVNGDGSTNGFGDPGLTNITTGVLANFLDGTFNQTQDALITPEVGASEPVTTLIREPLSGAYNTMEYNVPNSQPTKTSQDAGLNQLVVAANCNGTAVKYNPMNIPAGPGFRRRALTTSEELAESIIRTNSLGYGLWSVANFKGFTSAAAPNARYLTVDGVDPIQTSYTGGTIPTTPAQIANVSLANTLSGSYPLFSSIRLVNLGSSPSAAVTSLAAAAQNFAPGTGRPDFVPIGELKINRSHFIPPAGSGLPAAASNGSGKACGSVETGGDVGGLVVTKAGDFDFCYNYRNTTGVTGRRR